MNEKKLRILWSSNAAYTTSGYAQQTAEITPRIHAEGYPLANSNFFGQAGGKFGLGGILQYPVVNHTYGSDALVLHGKDFQSDVTISLQDIWVLHPNDLQQVSKWIPWVPIDHDPMTQGVLQNLRYAYRVIAMSKHGQKEMARNGIPSTYIPHTVDTNLFKPMNTPERKQASGIPADVFVVGMVAANKDNPPRKSFQEAMDAFKLFLEKVPKAVLYIHSNPDFPGGFNFVQYADFIGIRQHVLFPDPYQMSFNTPKEVMPLIYNTFDVLLAPSRSEGFGIPIIEAQACGVPVIVSNFTSMPELIQPGVTGELVDIAYKVFTPQGSYNAIPSVQSIYEKLLEVTRMDRGKTRDAARNWIVANFDTTKIFNEKWVPYLTQLETEVYGTPVLDKAEAKTK